MEETSITTAFDLRTRRKELKLTLEEMGRLTGLDKGCLSRLENSQTSEPRLSTVRMVAAGYQISLETAIRLFNKGGL